MRALHTRRGENGIVARHRKPLPPWLLGLLIAIAIFAIGILVFSALGYGDDPVIEPNVSGAVWITIGT